MAKYEVTYSCGHSGVVNLFGKTADRENKLHWYEAHALCPACHEKAIMEAREKQKEECKERAAELGLPELTGTEKQVKWALELRDKFIAEVDKQIDWYAGDNPLRLKGRILTAWKADCLKHSEAKWWIDHRFGNEQLDSTCRIMLLTLKNFAPKDYLASLSDEELGALAEKAARGREDLVLGETPVKKDEIEAMEEIKAEERAACTIKPENPKSPVHAEIRVAELEDGRKQVSVSTPSRVDEVVGLVKERLGYKWSGGAWRGVYAANSSVVDDRVCEIAAKILKCGYAVELPKQEFVSRVVNGEYKPYNPRRIFQFGDDKFIIYWGKDEDWYRVSKRLPGAEWNRKEGGVAVPAKSWALVEDFAERNKFDLSPGAQKLIAVSKEADRKALICEEIKEPETEARPAPGAIPKLEAKGGAVDESLVDREDDASD